MHRTTILILVTLLPLVAILAYKLGYASGQERAHIIHTANNSLIQFQNAQASYTHLAELGYANAAAKYKAMAFGHHADLMLTDPLTLIPRGSDIDPLHAIAEEVYPKALEAK